jgi:hypothetical protein
MSTRPILRRKYPNAIVLTARARRAFTSLIARVVVLLVSANLLVTDATSELSFFQILINPNEHSSGRPLVACA